MREITLLRVKIITSYIQKGKYRIDLASLRGAGSNMKGNILGGAAITFGATTTISGRALAGTGAGTIALATTVSAVTGTPPAGFPPPIVVANTVTDAGGNDLLRVAANGDVSLAATFSPASNGAEPVPTEVELGPDGALYVSQLTGAPFTKGVAGIFKIVNGQPQLVQGGFKTVIDFTFGPDGSMYVLEHASSDTFFGGPGRLTRVAPNGTRTLITEALNRPTSVLVGDDGAIYVSNNGVSVGTGEVLRIQP